jgi:hypothetical protein
VIGSSGIRQAGVDKADEMVTHAIGAHVDQILTGWREPLRPENETLHRAADQLDVADLNTADTAICQRHGHLELLGAAHASHARIGTAAEAPRVIATATGVPNRCEHAPLVLTDADIRVVESINAAARPASPTPWHVVRIGASPKLPTLTEFGQRVADDNRAAAERQRHLEEWRQPSGLDGRARREAVVP